MTSLSFEVGRSARALASIEAENVSHLAVAEHVAQGGAGALILAVGMAELVLGVWAAGWWQRAVVVLLAALGALAVGRAIAGLARRPSPSDRP